MVSTQEVKELTNILRNDAAVQKYFEEFVDNLLHHKVSVTGPLKMKAKAGILIDTPWYNIIHPALQEWKSMNGKDATVQQLMHVLSMTTDGGMRDALQNVNAYWEKNHGKEFNSPRHIEKDEVGVTYAKLFENVMDSKVENVYCEDPYIRLPYQVDNFKEFAQTVGTLCPNVKSVTLRTGIPDGEGDVENTLKNAMKFLETGSGGRIRFILDGVRGTKQKISNILHDRCVKLDKKHIVFMGRGLDIYQKSEATTAYTERKCKATSIIFALNK